MKIREAKYKTVRRATKVQVKDEVYGCDHCRKPITRGASKNGKHLAYLQATVFRNDAEAEHMEFCSWLCCLSGLQSVKTDYFISLPFLLYDERQPGIRAEDFFKSLIQFAASNTSQPEKS